MHKKRGDLQKQRLAAQNTLKADCVKLNLQKEQRKKRVWEKATKMHRFSIFGTFRTFSAVN